MCRADSGYWRRIPRITKKVAISLSGKTPPARSGLLIGASPPGSRKMPDRSASGFPSRIKAGRTSASCRPFRHVQQRSRVFTRPACALEQPALACRAARRLRQLILGRRKWPGKHRRSLKCRSAWKSTCTPAQRASNPPDDLLRLPWQTPSEPWQCRPVFRPLGAYRLDGFGLVAQSRSSIGFDIPPKIPTVHCRIVLRQ